MMQSPRDEAYAAREINKLSSPRCNQSFRLTITKAVLGPHGNYTPEAKALWQAYFDAGCPKNYKAGAA